MAKTLMTRERALRWLLRAAAIAAAGVLLNVVVFVVVLSRDALPGDRAPHAGAALRALPLVEQTPPVMSAAAPMVIYYTGDNGWQDGDLAFVHGFNRFGAPVVVIDSLHYFVRAHAAGDAAADLARVIDRYSAVWGPRRIVLAGYSYGADVAPVLARRLAPDLRARIALVAMIAPVGRAELVIRPWSLLNVIDDPHAYSVRSELEHLRGLPALCVWGADDPAAACPQFPANLARPARVAGGHRFVGHRAEVAQIILQAAGVPAQSANQPLPIGASASP